MITTTENPLRYALRKHPGEWMENLTVEGLVTVRGMYMPMQNEYFTFATGDGIYIDIERFPKGDFLADCYFLEPTKERKQHRKTFRNSDYKAVCTFAEEWLSRILEDHSELVVRFYPQMYVREGQADIFDYL